MGVGCLIKAGRVDWALVLWQSLVAAFFGLVGFGRMMARRKFRESARAGLLGGRDFVATGDFDGFVGG